MRGTPDETASVLETEAAAQGKDAPVEARRPVGGKALLRLAQLLDSAQPGAASETVVRAVGAEAVDAFRATAARFEGVGEVAGGSKPARSRARKTTTRKAASSALDMEQIGQLYLEVATNILGSPPTATGPQWRSLGPWTITNGQTYGTSRVNVSGRVAAIAVDPGNPAHVLMGAANGGVWESRDRGGSWAPRTDYAATLAVGAIAFDPSNPAIVYCGTGEGNWWSYLGAGVLRSTDGGTTWTTRCTAPFVGQGFYDLVVDPQNGNRLFAATTGGLYQSTNGGVTWTQRRAVTDVERRDHAAGRNGRSDPGRLPGRDLPLDQRRQHLDGCTTSWSPGVADEARRLDLPGQHRRGLRLGCGRAVCRGQPDADSLPLAARRPGHGRR